ncbi:MAG: 50S ribosomal protein L3 [Patescibacteria group bacterium]|nr:50S ribosomal protein L3 [Patescibacteria group bacterium]
MKFILGKKLEMTQKFKEDGVVVPVTLIKVEPCVVTQVKTLSKDGYSAVQIGCGEKKNLSKSLKGHVKDLSNLRFLNEFRINEDEAKEYNRGDKIEVDVFKEGHKVAVTGTSKGKGFQGVVKRHGFKGGPASHGHKDQERMPGSIGDTGAAKVFKGKKMAGRMGGDRVTVKNLEVVEVDKEKGMLAIKGAVPGARNGLVLIYT